MVKFLDRPPVRFVRSCVKLYLSKKVARVAAGIAYFLTLTIFPLMICLNAVLGFLDLSESEIYSLAAGFLPHVSQEFLATYFSYISINESWALFFAGLIFLLSTASAAYRSLTTAIADIYEQKPIAGARAMLMSAVFPVGFLLLVYLSIGVVLLGEQVLLFIMQEIGISFSYSIWFYLRYPILFVAVFLFIHMLSRLSLPRRFARAPVLLASLCSSCALSLASIIFSTFVSLSTRYSLVYGSLMSIIVMMIWLYLCGNILLSGNVIGCVYYRHCGVDMPKDGEDGESFTLWLSRLQAKASGAKDSLRKRF